MTGYDWLMPCEVASIDEDARLPVNHAWHLAEALLLYAGFPTASTASTASAIVVVQALV